MQTEDGEDGSGDEVKESGALRLYCLLVPRRAMVLRFDEAGYKISPRLEYVGYVLEA